MIQSKTLKDTQIDMMPYCMSYLPKYNLFLDKDTMNSQTRASSCRSLVKASLPTDWHIPSRHSSDNGGCRAVGAGDERYFV